MLFSVKFCKFFFRNCSLKFKYECIRFFKYYQRRYIQNFVKKYSKEKKLVGILKLLKNCLKINKNLNLKKISKNFYIFKY